MTPSKVDPAHLSEACDLLSEGGVKMLALMSLHAKLESGELRAMIVRAGDERAVILLDERDDWRKVELAHGPEAALLSGLKELRANSQALLWDEEAMKIGGEKLDELGCRLLQRQVFTQELARVPLDQPEPEGLDVSLLGDADRADARALFARTHAMSIEGLYATWPRPPTVDQCGVAFDGYLSGALGAPVPPACVVIRNQGRVVGVICCAQTEEEATGILLGLAVDPSERGRGLSRVLVRRAQRGLHASGFARMLFLTTDRNTPVHRLFTADEIIATETYPTRLWLRDAPERPEGKR